MLSTERVPKPKHFGIIITTHDAKRTGYKSWLATVRQGRSLSTYTASPQPPTLPPKIRKVERCLQIHFHLASQFPETKFALVLRKLAPSVLCYLT